MVKNLQFSKFLAIEMLFDWQHVYLIKRDSPLPPSIRKGWEREKMSANCEIFLGIFLPSRHPFCEDEVGIDSRVTRHHHGEGFPGAVIEVIFIN